MDAHERAHLMRAKSRAALRRKQLEESSMKNPINGGISREGKKEERERKGGKRKSRGWGAL